MQIIWIVMYFIPIIIVGAMDQSVALGMVLLTAAVPPVISIIADSREGRLGLWALWTLMYYLIAANMVMTKIGHPLFE